VELFLALADGGGGAAGVRHLAATQRSKLLVLLRYLTEAATAVGHPGADAASAAYRTLARLQRLAPVDCAVVLTHPPVAAWIIHTARLLARADGRDAARPEQLGLVAAAVAVRGRIPIRLDLPALGPADGAVGLPSLGAVDVTGLGGSGGCAPVALRVTAGGEPELAVAGTTVRVGAGARWRPLSVLSLRGPPALRLRIDRPNPTGFYAAEPPAPPADEELRRWRDRLSAGWRLLGAEHGDVAKEVAALTRTVSPLPPPPAGMVSGTYADAFGCVAMSLPPDARAAALTFAHEVQHAKLTALTDLLPLVAADRAAARGYAPWRDDPRPVAGLLHGVYAHLGVVRFWRRQRRVERAPADRLRCEIEFVRWRDGAREVADALLADGVLTDLGERFVRRIVARLDAWRDEPVRPDATATAGRLAEEHRARWLSGPAPTDRLSRRP
jgi:uncharacterized protein